MNGAFEAWTSTEDVNARDRSPSPCRRRALSCDAEEYALPREATETPGATLRMERSEAIAALRCITTFEDFNGRGVFIGINNSVVLRDGTRLEGELLHKRTELEWQRLCANVATIMMDVPKNISIDPANPQDLVRLLNDVAVDADGKAHDVCVMYWAMELAGSVNDKREGVGDPRAQMLCRALTDTQHKGQPYVYVFAHLQLASAKTRHGGAAVSCSPPAPTARFGDGLRRGFLGASYPSPTATLADRIPIREGVDAVTRALTSACLSDSVPDNADLTKDDLQKYAMPLTRSMESAESITNAEVLRSVVADNARRARGLMHGSRASSRASSTSTSPLVVAQTSPTTAGGEAPDQAEGAAPFMLPPSLVDTDESYSDS